MRRPLILLATAGLLALASCGINAPSSSGELNNGRFAYQCLDASDATCDGFAGTVPLPGLLAVGGGFDLTYTGKSAEGAPVQAIRRGHRRWAPLDQLRIARQAAADPALPPPAGTCRRQLRRCGAAVGVGGSVEQPRRPRGHLYLLVFDQMHIAPGNEHVARRAAETFIKTRVRPSDRIAVVGIPGPGPDLGFTADRTRAAAELAKVHGDLERNVKSAAGNLSVQEAYEIAAGNDRVVADVLDAAVGGSDGRRRRRGLRRHDRRRRPRAAPGRARTRRSCAR